MTMLKYGPPINVESIYQSLKRGHATVKRTAVAAPSPTAAAAPTPASPVAALAAGGLAAADLFKKPDLYYFSVNRSFHIKDFMSVDTDSFIDVLFIAILRRQAEAGAKEYWSQFNTRSRIERLAIIKSIRTSPEGERRNIKIHGYKRYMFGAKILTRPSTQKIRSFLVNKLKF